MRYATLILATSFIIGSIAGPLTPNINQCSLTCIDNKKFIYENGKSYIYNYVAETTTKLQRDGMQESNIRIRAKAEFEPITNCEYILRLRDVFLEDPKSDMPVIGAKDFQIALERYSLRFGNLDGQIKNVCPNNDEPIWVVNIKRGILSTFQNAMDNLEKEQSLQETDVTGQCMTHYTIEEGTWLSNTVIKKSKDLTGCTSRTDHYTSFQSKPYHPKINSKTPSLVDSHHNCEQIISKGQLQQSICVESHKFQPFSEGKSSGVISTNTQRLDFFKEEQGKYSGNEVVSKRASLLFDHKYRDFGQNSDEKDAENALRELCQIATDDIRPETPRLFSHFVHKLQELNYEKLLVIYKNVDQICNGNRKARKFLFDAVPLTGTDAGVTLMRDLILNNEISKTEADTWMLMLSFLPRPSKEIIASSMQLVDNPSEFPKGVLAVSSLTHSYCKANPDCDKDAEVKTLVKKLVYNLKRDCHSENDQQKEIILVTLKALGNIGYIEDALPILNKCYQSAANPIEVRLAALDAFRRLPCNFKRDAIFESFFNFEEDAEVRIGSYLAIMKCPTESILTKISEKLDNEEVNQVGSFVWTHLTSIQETSDPYKTQIKKILKNRNLQKKFSTDVRKFSRYFEGSVFVDSFKTGALADGTIIFSPKSYLPRSSTLGLTVDVFGESINLFEVGGRVEGFEFLVESFFGPKGYFPDDTIQKILESARDKKSYDESKLDRIAKIFNVKHLSGEEPRGEMFMRIFGNEINFMQFRGFEQLLQRSTDGFNILHELIQLTHKEDSEYTKSFMFLDSSLIIPTSVGLPLNITVNGTSTVNLKLGARLDLSQLRSKNLQFQLKVQPSASVEIAGSMVLDAFVTRTGLKMVATMHTSTYANGRIMLKNGEVLHANIDMPKNQMEIFDIQSKLYMIKGYEERVHDPLVDDHTSIKKCTGQGLSNVLGMQLCGEIEFPLVGNEDDAPFLPLAGPMAARIYLLKTDKTLDSYNLEYRWDRQLLTPSASQPYYVRTGRLSLDTPKSTVNRELTAEFVFNEGNRTVDILFVSPFKKMSFSGQFLGEKTYKVDASIKIDDKERFALQSDLQIDNTRNSFRLTPTVSLSIGGRPVIGFKGFAVKLDDKKYSMEASIEHITSQPVTLSGFLTKSYKDDKFRYDADFTFGSSPLDLFIKWFMQSDSSIVASKGIVEYSWQKREKKAVTFTTKSSKTKDSNAGVAYNLDADFQCTDYPHYNWALSWNMLRADGHMENSFSAFYGLDKSTSAKLISLQSRYKREGSLLEHRVASSFQFLYPLANLDTTIELNHELTTNSLNTNIILKPKPDKKVALILGLNKDVNQQELMRGLARFDFFGNQMEMTGNVLQPTAGDFQVNVGGKWANDAIATAVVTLKKRGPAHHSWGRELSVEFALPGQDSILLTGDVLLNGAEKSVHGEANVNGQRYRTFAEYHRPSLENVRISAGTTSPSHEYVANGQFYNTANEQSATTDVRLANWRRILTEIHLKRDGIRTNAKASMALDADRKPEKKYVAQLDFQKLFSGSEGSIAVNCPLHDFDMGVSWNVSAKNSHTLAGHSEVWFAENRMTADGELKATLRPTSRDINASLKVNTLFDGLRTIATTVTHSDNGNTWKNTALVQVDDEVVSTWDSRGSFFMNDASSNIDMDVKIDIPMFEKPIVFSVNHSWTQRDMDIVLSFGRSADQPIRFAFTFIDHSIPGKLHHMLNANLTTPYSWIRNVGYATNLLCNDKTMIQAEMHWEDRRILVDYEGSSRLIGDKIDSYSTIQVNTPFQNFETVSSSLRFAMDASSLTSAVDFVWDKQRVALEFAGTSQIGAFGRNAMASLHFVSPFYPLDDLLLTVEENHQQTRTKYDVEVKWASNRAFVTQLEYHVQTSNNVYVKLDVVEPFDIFNQFGSELNYSIADNRFLGKLVGSLNKNTLDTSADVRKIMNIDGSLSLSGLATLNVPLAGIHDMRMEFEYKSKPFSYDAQANVEVNGRKMSFKHELRWIVWTNFYHNMHITLPEEIFLIREINLKNVQLIEGNTHKHESEFGYAPDRKYSVAAELTARIAADQNHLNGNIKLDTPQQRYGPFRILATHNIKDKAVDSQLAMEYWPGKKIDFLAVLEADSLTGMGHAKLTSPIPGFESISLSGNYNLGGDEKTGNAIVQWTADKLIKAAMKHQMNSRHLKSEISLSTPFEGYKNTSASLSYSGDSATNMGEVVGTFADQTVTISAKGNMDNGKGNLAISVSSPFKGFENFAVATDFDVTSLEKKATFKSTGSNIKITAFHNMQSKSMDSGITFTSTIQGFEHIFLGSHFDDMDGEKKSTISIEKGSTFKVHWLANYMIRPQNGHLTIAFSSPIEGLESMRFGSKYQYLSQEKEFTLDLAYKEKVVEFHSNLKSSNKLKHQATVLLTTPCPHFGKMSFVGRYDLTGKIKVGEVTLTRNEKEANLKWELEMNHVQSDVKITMTSPVQGMEDLQFKGSLKQEKEVMNADLHFMKGLQVFEASMLTSVSPLKGIAKIIVKSPINGYKSISSSVQYESMRNKREVKILFEKEQMKVAVQCILSRDANVTEISFDITTPIPKFERIGLSGKSDTSRPKSFHTATYRRGEEKYSATVELLRLPSYFELNLLAKTPSKDASFYANYNFMNPNALGFDIKILKETHMAEMKGRFRKQHFKDNSEGYVSFNTNYMHMTSVSLGFMYDNSQPMIKELKLHCNVNGLNNDLTGLLNLKEEDFVASVKGTSAYLGWQTYNFIAKKMLMESKAAVFQVTIDINDTPLQVNATVIELDKVKSRVTFSLTTPYETYSLVMSRGAEDLRTYADISVRKGANQIFDALFKTYRDHDKFESSVKIHSIFDKLKTFSASFSREGEKADATLNTDMNGHNLAVDYKKKFGSRAQVDIVIRSSFYLPFVNTRVMRTQLVSDMINGTAQALVTSEEQVIFNISLDRSSTDNTILQFYSPVTKDVIIRVHGFSAKHFAFEIEKQKEIVTKVTSEIHASSLALEFSTALIFNQPFSILLRCIDEGDKKSVSTNITHSTSYVEFGASLLTTSVDRVTHFETNAGMKSSFKNWENVQFEMLSVVNTAAALVTMTSSLLWAADHRMHLSFKAAPSSGIHCTFMSPFVGYENISIVAEQVWDDSQYKGHLVGQWSATKVGTMITYMPGQATVVISSPFRGFESLSALLRYNHETFETTLIIQTSPDKQIELNTYANLEARKSSVKVSLVTPFADHANYILEGEYDFTTQHRVRLQAEGRGKKFQTKLHCIRDVGRSSQLKLEINTPMEILKAFSLIAEYGNIENSTDATISVNANDHLIEALGNVARSADGINFTFKTSSPVPGYERFLVSGQSNVTGVQRSADLLFKLNDNPMLTFTADVESNFPRGLAAHLKLNTPIGPIKSLGIDASYVRNREGTKITNKFGWNSAKKVIQMEGQIKQGEITASLSTPFSPVRNVRFSSKLKLNPKHFMLLSTVEVEEYNGKFHLEMKNHLPSHYEAKFELATPFSQFEGLTSRLVFTAQPDGRLVDAKFLLEMPLEDFRITEASLLFKNNDFKKTELQIRLNLPHLSYSVDGTMENDDFGNSETLVTIKTPHRNLESVAFKSHFVYVDNAERGAIITFTLPKSTHSVRGSYVLKMGNIGFQLGAESTMLTPYSPLALQGKYDKNGGSSRLAFGFVGPKMTRVLTWTQDVDATSYKGKFAYDWPSQDDVTSTYFVEYNVDLPAPSSGTDVGITVVSTHQVGDVKNEVASITVSLKEESRFFDAVLSYNYARSEHSLHAEYKIMDNAVLETSVKMKSPILPSHEASLSAVLNPKEAAINFIIGKVENSIILSYKIEASEFEGTLKVNMPILNIKGFTVICKLYAHSTNLKGELTARTLTTIHSVTAYLIQSPKEKQFRLNVRTPIGGLNHFMINGHVVTKSEKEVRAVIAATFLRKVHKLTADFVHDDVAIDASFKVESPFLNEKELAVQLRLSKDGSNGGNGMIKITNDGVNHKGQFHFAGGSEESTAELLLETPLWNLDSLSIKSNLLKHKQERLDANFVVATPKTTHSLGFQVHQNSTQKNVHLTAYTPFLKSGQFSITAKAIHDASTRTLEFTIHTLESNHTIKFEHQKSKLQGTSLLTTLTTPFLGIRMISFRASVVEISSHKVDASLELNFGERSHLMNVKAGYESGKVDYAMILQSPFLGSGYISTNGQISINDHHRINIDITISSHTSQLYSLHGYFQRHPKEGLEAWFELTAPGMDPITFLVQISQMNLNNFRINLIANTPLGEHGINAHLRRKDTAVEFLLKLDSSLMPCQSLSLSGTVVLKMPLHLEGNFALETPGKTFRFASNYKMLDSGNLNGGFTIVTPFQIMPLLKVNGNLERSKGSSGGFDGSLKMHTIEEDHPDAALYVAYDGDSDSSPYIILKLQVPMLGYPDVSFNYGSQLLKDSSLFNTLKFKVNSFIYGYDCTVLRKPGLQDLQIKGYAGRDTLSMKTTIERNEGYLINISLETPFKSFENVKYNLRYHNAGSGKYGLQNTISFAKYRLGFNGELDLIDGGNFDGKALIETSIKGYENVGFKCQRRSKDGYLWGTLEQVFGELVAVRFLVENYQNASDGSGKLELTTPFRLLRSADAYYEYDNSHENAISANLGLNHNGRNVVHVNAVSKSGTKIVEIVNPIHPVTVEYTYVESGDVVTVRGKYCWDASRGIAATIGFDAKITATNLGREVVVHTIHPSRPLKLTFSLETSENSIVHRGEISWNDALDTDSVGYVVETRSVVGHGLGGKMSYDVITKLRLPIREFQLINHWEKDGVMAKYETAFMWDGTRDSDELIALALEHRTLQSGRWATVSFRYPKINQNYTLHGEFMNNPTKTDVFNALLEFIYSQTPSEKFTLQSTLTNHKGYNLDVVAKHPASNIDLKMVSSLMNDKEEMRAAVKLDYLDQFGHAGHVELRSKIMKLNNHIHMMLKSHAQQLEINARLRNLHKGYLMHMDSKLNDKEPFTVELQLQNMGAPMATFNAVYDPRTKRSINVRAGMQDMKTILMEAYHHDDSVTTEEMSLLMTLNRSREFITRFNWHPGVLQDIENGFGPIIHSVCINVRDFMDRLISGVSQEYSNKVILVKESLRQAVRPIVSSINEEIAEFERESTELRQSILKLYKNNEFYLGDIYDSVASWNIYGHICDFVTTATQPVVHAFQYVVDSMAMALKELSQMCDSLCTNMAAVVNGRIRDIPYIILHYASELNSLGSKAVNEVALRGLKFMRDLVFYSVPPMSKWQISSPEWVQRISNSVALKLQDYVDRFFQSSYYQQLMDNFDQLRQSFQTLYNNELVQHWLVYAQPIYEYFEASIASFLEHPYVRFIFKTTDYAYELTTWAYNFFKIQDRAKDLLGLIIARGEDVALYLLQEMVLPEYRLPSLKQDVIFEPNNGKLQILQTLPVMWSSFADFPNIYDSVEYSDLVNLKDHIIRLPKASLNKLLHAMRSEFSWKHMVPAFRGHALLVGNQHYMTFDGRAYEFAGECSYLLAHDFMDNNFTAIVKYSPVDKDQVEKKSFLIIFDGHNIELHPNLTVVVDGQRKELPLTLTHTHIARTHNALTLANEAKQIWARYESTHDVFMLEIGGFYHGKTAGLFGSYDHEPFDDFKTPARKTASNLEEFASSWEIGSKTCMSDKNYAHHVATNSYAIQKPCNDIFSEYETLTPCLRKINPGPYKRMCVNDVSIGKPPCAAVAAYAMMCQASGIAVTLPDTCSECRINDRMVPQGKEVVLEGATVPQSLDVVFIIDNTWQCSTTFPKLRSTLATISRNVEGAVSTIPLSGVRYAVVGFGVGAPYVPQAITANGDIFGTIATLDLALNNTHFAAGHHHHMAQLIEFAADLPFRAGVGKVMIVMPCAEPPEMSKDYAKLAEKLKDMDIKLHVTSIHELILNGINKIKVSDVMGFDRDLAYTLNLAERGKLVGDKEIRHQMNIPKNTLTQMALDTNGSVFYASKLASDQPSTSILTTEVFSRRIAQNAAPASCQNCLCSTGVDGMPKAVCTKCYSSELS